MFFLIDRLRRDHELVYGKMPGVTSDFMVVRRALVAKNPLIPVEVLWPLEKGGFAHQIIFLRALDSDNMVHLTPPIQDSIFSFAVPPFWEKEPPLIPAPELNALFSEHRACALLA